MQIEYNSYRGVIQLNSKTSAKGHLIETDTFPRLILNHGPSFLHVLTTLNPAISTLQEDIFLVPRVSGYWMFERNKKIYGKQDQRITTSMGVFIGTLTPKTLRFRSIAKLNRTRQSVDSTMPGNLLDATESSQLFRIKLRLELILKVWYHTLIMHGYKRK